MATRYKRVSLIFRWYDFYVGVYIDRLNRTTYIFPVPMLGVRVEWHRNECGCTKCQHRRRNRQQRQDERCTLTIVKDAPRAPDGYSKRQDHVKGVMLVECRAIPRDATSDVYLERYREVWPGQVSSVSVENQGEQTRVCMRLGNEKFVVYRQWDM